MLYKSPFLSSLFFSAAPSQLCLPHGFQYLLSSTLYFCTMLLDQALRGKAKAENSSCAGEQIMCFSYSAVFISFLFPPCMYVDLSCICSIIAAGGLARISSGPYANSFLRVVLNGFLPLWLCSFLPSSLVFNTCYTLEAKSSWSWLLLLSGHVWGDVVTEQNQLPCTVSQVLSMS